MAFLTLCLVHLSILQLSYTNPPQLPRGLSCSKWIIKCESHTPYVVNLLNAVPLNCDLLHIEVDNVGLGEVADMEQVITAKDLTLRTSGSEDGISSEQIAKFQARRLNLNGKVERIFE